MQYVIVRWESHPGGYWLDPRPYLEALSEIADVLPPGARSYAGDPDHYDFNSGHCVKDLRFTSLAFDDATHSVTVNFAANPWKHIAGLVLAYTEVRSLSVDRDGANEIGWMGTLLLDEILPADGGASHEIRLTSGTIKIVASDVKARWQ